MIQEKIVDFMHGAVLAWVGTRDARLRPALTWAFGVPVSAARDEVTAFVPDIEIDQTRSSLSQNGLVALNVVERDIDYGELLAPKPHRHWSH
jgi:hypothetical protein